MLFVRRSFRNKNLVKTTNSAKMITTAGAMWTRKSLNVQFGPAADDDVRRVTDQRRGAADVGRQHLGDQEWLCGDVEAVADDERDLRPA